MIQMPKLPLVTSLAFALWSCGAQAETMLTYQTWGDASDAVLWQKMADAFHAANPDITVTVALTQPDLFWEQLHHQAETGALPDLFAMDGANFPEWRSKGALLDLQPYVDAEPDLIAGLFLGPLSMYRKDGDAYGMPLDCQTVVMYYNKQIFDAAKQPYPNQDWTIATLRRVAKALTLDHDGDGKTVQWGISADMWDMSPFWGPVVMAQGGNILDLSDRKTLLSQGGSPAALALIRDMAMKDRSIMLPVEKAQIGGDGFAAGLAAMTFADHRVVPAYSKLPFDWGVAPFPKGDKERVTLMETSGIVANAQTSHPAEAWKFIQFAISPEGQTLLASRGTALPVSSAVVNSAAYRDQPHAQDQKMFIEAMSYARLKPAFKGYAQWASLVNDPLSLVWSGEASLDEALGEIAASADEALAP